MIKQFSPEERKKLIDSYAAAHSLLMDALSTLPKEMWKYKPSPEKWSIHEILVHIADAEINSSVRLRTLLAMPGTHVLTYDQDAYAIALNYHDHSVVTALDLFRVLRQSNTSLLRATDDSVFANTVIHPDHGEMNLDHWLTIYERHTPMHIEQMRRNLEHWKQSQS